MPEITPCPICKELPENCTCPSGDRWIPLEGLWLHLSADGFVDVRVFPTTTDENIREASPTIRDWAKRAYFSNPHDLRAQIKAAYIGGSQAGAIAWWLGQRHGLSGLELESFAQVAGRNGLEPRQIAEWLNACLEGYAKKGGVWIQAGINDLMAVDKKMKASEAHDIMLGGVFLRNSPVTPPLVRGGVLKGVKKKPAN